MRRQALRLLPLCLAIAGAARAQDPAPAADWALCPSPDGLPLFQPLADPAVAADPATLATDISAENLDVSGRETTVFQGGVELRRGGQWLGTDKLTYSHDSERFVT